MDTLDAYCYLYHSGLILTSLLTLNSGLPTVLKGLGAASE